MIARSRIGSFASAGEADRRPLTHGRRSPFGVRSRFRPAPSPIWRPRGSPASSAAGPFAFTVRGNARRATTPKLRLVVEPAPRAALPPRSARTLEATVAGYLRYARTRQFERYLANPDPRGRTATTYLYETVAPPRRARKRWRLRRRLRTADGARRRSRHRRRLRARRSLGTPLTREGPAVAGPSRRSVVDVSALRAEERLHPVHQVGLLRRRAVRLERECEEDDLVRARE